jgi:hypothetical protein
MPSSSKSPPSGSPRPFAFPVRTQRFLEWLSSWSEAQLSPVEMALHIETYPRMTEAQAAEFLGCSVKALQKWRVEGGGPAFVKASALVRYRLRDLLAWEGQRLAAHTSGIRKYSPGRDDQPQSSNV